MKTATVREFRSRLAELIASDEPVLVTRRGKPTALLLSLKDPQRIPAKVRRELFLAMASDIAKQLRAGKITKEKIERDFRTYQKCRRRYV